MHDRLMGAIGVAGIVIIFVASCVVCALMPPI